MKSVLRLALCAAALIASQPILAGPAAAQDAQRIAAVVNDEIVSMHDLRARLQMVIVSSRLPATDETAQRIAPQVLRSLIDEQIQLQEAERVNIAVTRSEEHTSELQSLMRISYAVFCLKKK